MERLVTSSKSQVSPAWIGVLHGSTGGWQQPRPHLNSCDADGDRASQFPHLVQDVDGDANLGAPPPIPARAQRHQIGTVRG
jgi:hypothetical protein